MGRHRLSRRRLDVKEAAEVLGISSEGVRKRIKRGTLASEKEPGGRVFVWLDEDWTKSDEGSDRDRTKGRTESDSELVEVLREQLSRTWAQLEAEREANRENRRIIAGLTQRIPAIESPPEAPQSSVTASEDPGRGVPPDDKGVDSRPPWWKRWFG